jgi:hypothetical protein
MKAAFLLALALGLASSARAPAPGAACSPEPLDQMLGAITLYPDPLLALILPVSTGPADVTRPPMIDFDPDRDGTVVKSC